MATWRRFGQREGLFDDTDRVTETGRDPETGHFDVYPLVVDQQTRRMSKVPHCRKVLVFVPLFCHPDLPSPTSRYREIPLSNRPSLPSRRSAKYLTIGTVPSGHDTENNADAQMVPPPRLFRLLVLPFFTKLRPS